MQTVSLVNYPPAVDLCLIFQSRVLSYVSFLSVSSSLRAVLIKASHSVSIFSRVSREER